MECPNCGEQASFASHSAQSVEPHGESHFEEWLVCGECGARTDEKELARAQADDGEPRYERAS